MMRLLRRYAPRNDCRGFTLVELIIMTAVGGVLLTGLGLSVQNQINASITNRNYLVALQLAKRQMAIVQNAAYPSPMGETAQTVDANFPDFFPTLQVVTADTNGPVTLLEIYVRVREGSSSGPLLVELFTYRSNLVTYGNGT